MKFVKNFPIVLLITTLIFPACFFAESPSPSPSRTPEPQVAAEQQIGLTKVDIYVFAVNVLGIRFNKKAFPVFINGLLITSLDYAEYIHYETDQTSFKVATFHVEVSTTNKLFSNNLVADTIYSELKISDAKPRQSYFIEIQSSGGNRIKLLNKEDGEKKLKSCREISY